MTIYRTAYHTSSHQGYQIQRTQAALKAATAMGVVDHVGPALYVLNDGENYRNAVPAFAHPMEFECTGGTSGEKHALAIDIRPFGSWSKIQNDFIIRNMGEVKFNLLRLRLNQIWLNDNPMYLRNISSVPIKVYANWISRSLSNRFMLDPINQMKLTILAGILYYSLFSDDKDLDDNERVRVSGALARELNIAQKDVLEVLDEYPVITSIGHFCDIAGEATQSVQLRGLNTGLLVTALGGSWFGVNYKEILAAALEHPPTWIAICYTAGTDRSYRTTTITNIFERQASRGADQMFYNALSKLLDSLAPLDSTPRHKYA